MLFRSIDRETWIQRAGHPSMRTCRNTGDCSFGSLAFVWPQRSENLCPNESHSFSISIYRESSIKIECVCRCCSLEIRVSIDSTNRVEAMLASSIGWFDPSRPNNARAHSSSRSQSSERSTGDKGSRSPSALPGRSTPKHRESLEYAATNRNGQER